jgi:two-component system response regulator AtoC
MPGLTAGLLAWLKEQGLRVPVIMISAYGEIRDAVEAMKLGARDYVVKPFDPEELVVRLKRVLESRRLEAEVELAAAPEGLEVLGDAPAMREIRAMVEKVAATVLITGRAAPAEDRAVDPPVGQTGLRAGERGRIPVPAGERAFRLRGARSRPAQAQHVRVGSTGTLFLDEIGDMPLPYGQALRCWLTAGSARAALSIVDAGDLSHQPTDALVAGALPRGPVLAERHPLSFTRCAIGGDSPLVGRLITA